MRAKARIVGVILGVVVYSSIAGTAKAQPGLVAYWRFDETTGTTAVDSMGAYSGTLYGPTHVPGKFGNAVSFDGVNDYVNLISGSLLVNAVSVSMWFKTSTDYSKRDLGFLYSDDWGCFVAVTTSNTLMLHVFMFYCGGNITTPNTVNDGQWHHVVGTWYIGGGAKLYLDGALVGSLSFGWAEYTGIWNMILGKYGKGGYFYSGLIDDVRVFKVVMSDEGALALYRSTPGPPLAPPANFTAVAINATQINVTWTNTATDVEGFEFQGPGGLKMTFGPNVTEFASLPLSQGSTNWYIIRSWNWATGCSPWAVTSATTPVNDFGTIVTDNFQSQPAGADLVGLNDGSGWAGPWLDRYSAAGDIRVKSGSPPGVQFTGAGGGGRACAARQFGVPLQNGKVYYLAWNILYPSSTNWSTATAYVSFLKGMAENDEVISVGVLDPATTPAWQLRCYTPAERRLIGPPAAFMTWNSRDYVQLILNGGHDSIYVWVGDSWGRATGPPDMMLENIPLVAKDGASSEVCYVSLDLNQCVGTFFSGLTVNTKPVRPLTDFQATPDFGGIRLSWGYPPGVVLAGAKILRRMDRYPGNTTDGLTVFYGPGNQCRDTEVVVGRKYYYTAYGYDAVGTFTEGAAASAMIQLTATSFPAAVVRFQSSATSCGIAATLPRSQAIGDYGGDGDLDLFFSETSAPAHLFVNNGSGFFTDRAASAGLALTGLGLVSKSLFWDFNNDGHLDLFIAQMSGNRHMVNQGDGTYVDRATSAGLVGTARCNSAVALDHNQDGLLDLYLGQGDSNTSAVHRLLRNRGDGTFEDVTTSAGLGASFYGGGALVADFDLDGHPDIYVIHNGTNHPYHNNGNGTFTELTGIGASDTGLGNGGAVGDFDDDGDFDIFIANDNGPVRLLRNNFMETGSLTFTDVTAAAGLGGITDNATDASFGDVDNDGNLDLYVSVRDKGGTWQDHFYLNNGNGTFADYTTSAGLTDSAYRNGYGCGMADLNGDGKLEIVVSCADYAILKNLTAGAGHWLSVDLRGTSSTREAVGARVTLIPYPYGQIQVRERQCGKPRGTQDSPWLHFGLRDHDGPVAVLVNWPSGRKDQYWIRTVDKHVTLVEGLGADMIPPVLNSEPALTNGTTNSLSWNSVTSATACYLEWSRNNSFAPAAGNSGWTTATSHIATGLVDGAIYYYRAKSRNASLVESDWSNVVSSRQDASAPTAPGTPTEAGIYTSFTHVMFTWTAATDTGSTPSGVASYDLQVVHGWGWPGVTTVFNGNVGNVLSRLVGGSPGQRLFARVRAVDQVGNAGPWSPVSDGILIDIAAPGSPGTPTDAGACTSSTSVRFNWDAATDPGTGTNIGPTSSGLASYDLQVGTGPGMSNVFNGNVGNVLTYQVTGLNGQRLYARARARDRAGNIGAWSDNSDGILIDTVAPAAPPRPTDVGAYTSSTQVTFIWAAATDPGTTPSGVASYDVRVGTAPGLSNIYDHNPGNVLSYQAAGLNGKRLYARVRAHDQAGNVGPWSLDSDGILIDTVTPAVPGRPTDPGAYTSSTLVRFNWTAATDGGTTPAGLACYHLHVGTASGLSNVFDADVGNVLTYQATGLNGRRLFARVCARDRAGNSGSWSLDSDGILVDTVAPGVPGTPTDAGAYTSSTSVRFKWTAATDGGTTPSGVASYDLQVGTGPGLGNVLNGNVGSVLTRQVTGSNGQQLYARVRARDKAGNISAWSGNSNGVTVDTVRPRLVGVTAQNDGNLRITFGETVVNADKAANYTFTRGLRVVGVAQIMGSQYRLYTAPQTPGTSYTLTVGSAVTDRAGNPVDPAHRSLAFTGGVRTDAAAWPLYR